MTVRLAVKPKVFTCPSEVLLNPQSTTPVELCFTPTETGVEDGKLVIENDNKQLVISLVGEGIEAVRSISEMNSQELRFPSCELGAVVRAQLRVSNRANKKMRMNAKTEPPFNCPCPEFEVNPMSYVLMPIRFMPNESGEYQGRVEVVSSDGRSFQIQLSGLCVDDV
jgi:hypothetical protein